MKQIVGKSSNQATAEHFDIAIVGGGLVGSSLALALANTPYRIAVIEPFEVDHDAQPSFDERTIALTYSAKHIFSQIGAWTDAIENEACAIRSIHISNKGHLGLTQLSHEDIGTPALGYVIPTRVLGRSLNQQLSSASNVQFFCPYEVIEVKAQADEALVHYQHRDTKQSSELSAKLVVLADGGRSNLLESLGINCQQKTYSQSALLSIVKSNRAHNNKAYERFDEDGPLALLPLNGQRFAVVWTLSPEALSHTQGLNDEAFLKHLQSSFGTRAGLFSEASARKSYALNKSSLQTFHAQRVLVLGNAAHTVHPVAGQGFNLGLRDVAALAEQLLAVPSKEGTQDIGAAAFLANYSQSRQADTKRVLQFTDGLLKLFSHPSPLVKIGRNLGLIAIENLPFVKRALLRRSMGMGKHQPRLARGLKIRE